MMIYLLSILLTLIISQSKLVYVSSVLRHGARYPIRGDIYDGNDTKQFAGRLTSVGMRQQFLLGGYLKADYIDKLKLINSTLYNKEVEVFSDSSERCQQSALSHLLGLFPFGTGQRVPENIDPSMLEPPFQSFLKQSLRKNKKSSIGNYALKLGFEPAPYKNATIFFPKCPNQNKIYEARAKSQAVKVAQFQAVHAAFTQKMRIMFNLSTEFANVAGLAELFDVVTCDMYLGRPLPTQFTDYDYKQLTYIQNYLFSLVYGGQVSQIFSTPVLQGILHNMDNRVKNGDKQALKYSIISGHDTTIMPMLTFLNLTTPECISRKWKNQTYTGNCANAPPFASSLIFQLHQNQQTKQYTVKVRYNGQYYNLCGTESKQCNYVKFSEIVRKKLVDFNQECGVKSQGNISEIQNLIE